VVPYCSFNSSIEPLATDSPSFIIRTLSQILSVSVVVEEWTKALAPIVLIRKGYKNHTLFGILSGTGYFLGEKGLMLAFLSLGFAVIFSPSAIGPELAAELKIGGMGQRQFFSMLPLKLCLKCLSELLLLIPTFV